MRSASIRGYLQTTRKGSRGVGCAGCTDVGVAGSKMQEIGKGEGSDAPAASRRA
jgi:hypothetical protein